MYMQRCIDLALQGAGRVAPNPMVGAVLVYQNRIIGEGYHTAYGAAHAEVEALCAVTPENRHLIPLSTLYVNLEPCAHRGKTPPCTNLILEHRIQTVVVGQTDPNPLVSGKGVSILRAAGLDIHTGILEQACEQLNKRFNTYHRLKRPYIILKWAQTADGFIATENGRRESISDHTSQIILHQWRGQEQSILIGYRTALLDNPSLNVRLCKGNHPIRLVIDYENTLPPNLNLFDGSIPTYVFTTSSKRQHNDKLLDKDRLYPSFMDELYKLSIQSVLVEGGAALHQQLVSEQLWDEARVFQSPVYLGAEHGVQAVSLKGSPAETHTLNKDKLLIYFNS